MKSLHLATVAILAVSLLAPASAAAEGWGMPNLNPFAKKGKSRASASVSDAPTSGWKLPKLWPSSSTTAVKPRTSRPAKPSTWQKMTAGTKSAMSKTADVLNPFDDANDKEPQRLTGSNTVFSQASRNKESKGRSFLPSWPWGGAEEDTGPKDVNSFLSQERPDWQQ